MTEYQKLLFLTYFKECNEVDFNELIFLLGLNRNSFDELIQEMVEANYISYINYKLQITERGIRYLIAKNQINSEIENDDFILRNISPNKAISLDEPFAPKDFMSKIE